MLHLHRHGKALASATSERDWMHRCFDELVESESGCRGTAGTCGMRTATRAVKQVVTGAGGAGKDQVQTMVRALLRIEEVLQADAADGLAIAVRHAHSRVGRGGCTVPSPPARRRSRGRGLRL